MPLNDASATSSGVSCGLSATSKWNFFSVCGRRQRQVQRDHRRRRAQLAHHRRLPVLRQRADCAARADHLRGRLRRRQRHHHVRARERNRHGAETKQRMPAGVQPVASTDVTVQPALSERSPRTRSIPTMSPGLICASVGEAAAFPPAIAAIPQDANWSLNCASVSGYSPR